MNVAILDDDKEYLNYFSQRVLHDRCFNLVFSEDILSYDRNVWSNLRPDVIIISASGLNGSITEEIKGIKALFAEAVILLLANIENMQGVVAALKNGANGCMLKNDSWPKIIDAVYDIYRGECPLNGKVAKLLLDHLTQKNKTEISKTLNLTPKEEEIFVLLIEGFSYKQICSKKAISMNTLFTHVKNLYKKLKVHSRAELSANYRKYISSNINM